MPPASLEKKNGLIDLPIAKTTSFQKQKIAQGKFGGTSKQAQTEYQVLKEFSLCICNQKVLIELKKSNEKKFFDLMENKIYLSLLLVKPKTGRTHQIRVHFSSIGFPLFGDTIYGKPTKELHRHFLHAHLLGFKLPFSNKYVEFKSDLPFELKDVLKKIDAEYTG